MTTAALLHLEELIIKKHCFDEVVMGGVEHTFLASNFHSCRKSKTDGTSELLAEVAYNVKVIHFTKAHKIWC